jgi:hypothetical protein
VTELSAFVRDELGGAEVVAVEVAAGFDGGALLLLAVDLGDLARNLSVGAAPQRQSPRASLGAIGVAELERQLVLGRQLVNEVAQAAEALPPESSWCWKVCPNCGMLAPDLTCRRLACRTARQAHAGSSYRIIAQA